VATTPNATAVTIPVTANDSDADGTLDCSTIDLDPATAGVQTTMTVTGGTFAVNGCNVDFTPNGTFSGTATINYTINDNSGATSNVSSITVTVDAPANVPPVTVNDVATTPNATAVTIPVTANDSDADGTLDCSTIDLDPATAGVQTTMTVTGGTFAVNGCNVDFTPNGTFSGTATINYTINDNSGATSNVSSITVTVDAPANVPPVTVNDVATTPNATAVTIPVTANDSDADGTLDCATIDLDPATAGTQTTMTVTGGTFAVNGCNVDFTPNGTFSGTACVNYTINDNSGATSNASSICVTVLPSIQNADLGITKTISNNNPLFGSQVTFTITVNNAGPDAATAVIVNEILQSGYTLVSASASIGNYNQSNGQWSVGTMLNGSSETLTIIATVNTTGNYFNTASVSSSTTDPTTSNNSASVTPVPAITVPSLGITKVVDNQTPVYGQNVNFTITVTNTGTGTAYNVLVNDQLPSGYTYVTSTSSIGTYNPATGVWSIDSIMAQSNAQLIVTAMVNSVGDYMNVANINTGNAGSPSDSAFVTPVGVPTSLSIEKSVNQHYVPAGTEVTFTVSVTNNGSSPALNVSVNDILPSGYTFLNATASQGTYNTNTGLWSIGALPGGQTASILMNVIVNASGDYINRATVSSPSDLSGPHSDTASVIMTGKSAMEVTKEASNLTVVDSTGVVKYKITYTITVDNNGTSALNNLQVIDDLKQTFAGADTFYVENISSSNPSLVANTNFNGSANTNLLNAASSSLAVGTSGAISFDVYFESNEGVTYTNTATGTAISNGLNVTDTGVVKITTTKLNKLEIPEAFSPNGDSYNEEFKIQGIENYPNNTLLIFNRWGNKVYEKAGYMNEWKGENTNNFSVGNGTLPEGTYFYVLDLGDGSGKYTGYVYLKRQ
jgi:gliding motility-associated-like protein/uncharacterized repeat protein (TIGR01451 family)